MLVSIVISNYNYATYVGQAIDSALSQSHGPLEVIVVDDGSTDCSRDVIAAYGNRVQAVLKQNGGLNSACNAGWEQAKGDVIIFLDADDVLLPGAAEACVSSLQGKRIAKAQFLLQRVDGELKPLGGVMPTYGHVGGDIRRDMLQWGYYLSPPMSGNAYTRAFLEMVMPSPQEHKSGYIVSTDGYLCGLAPLLGDVVSLQQVLGLYRIHGNNMSDAGKIESVEKLRKLFMLDYLREEQQVQWAAKSGKPCNRDRSRFHPTVCKQRFLAYRLNPEDHPVPQDTRLGLLAAGMWGAVRFPYINVRKRIFIICGFIALGFMPRNVLRGMIEAVAKPERRTGLFRLFRFGM